MNARLLTCAFVAVAALVSGCTGPVGSGATDASHYTPTAVSGLLDKLRAGTAPAAIWLAGDSTGNNGDEWFCTSMDWLGEQFPAYSVSHLAWDDALQAWEPSLLTAGIGCSAQTGTAGDRNMVSSATGYASVVNSPALTTTGNLDVRAKVAPEHWAGVPAAQTVAAKAGGPGDRAWRLQVDTRGRLVLGWSANGTDLVSAVSTAAVPFADGAPGWVRGTVEHGGAAGSTVRFYTSRDGAHWDPLGSASGVRGANGIFPAVHGIEIGAHSGGAEPLVGRDYYLEVRGGVDGAPVAVVDLDAATDGATSFADYLGNTVTLVGKPRLTGAPGLVMYNGSVAGCIIEYTLEPSRFPKMTPVPADVAFTNFGHNYGFVPSMQEPYGHLTDAIVERWPAARIVVVAQSPQNPPREPVQIAGQDARMREVLALAKKRRFGLIDAYTPMADDRAVNVGEDGLHLTDAGKKLWKERAIAMFTHARDLENAAAAGGGQFR